MTTPAAAAPPVPTTPTAPSGHGHAAEPSAATTVGPGPGAGTGTATTAPRRSGTLRRSETLTNAPSARERFAAAVRDVEQDFARDAEKEAARDRDRDGSSVRRSKADSDGDEEQRVPVIHNSVSRRASYAYPCGRSCDVRCLQRSAKTMEERLRPTVALAQTARNKAHFTGAFDTPPHTLVG
jgi:hypothetical protein